MTEANQKECPGCGLKLPDQNLPHNDRFNASGECWKIYEELLSYTLSRNDRDFIHQFAVDAYTAQHSGEVTRNIATAFALIGLYFSAEKGYTGKQVQRVHTALAKNRVKWESSTPHNMTGTFTVLDVLTAEPGEERDKMIIKWAESVWRSWQSIHDRIKYLASKYKLQ